MLHVLYYSLHVDVLRCLLPSGTPISLVHFALAVSYSPISDIDPHRTASRNHPNTYSLVCHRLAKPRVPLPLLPDLGSQPYRRYWCPSGTAAGSTAVTRNY